MKLLEQNVVIYRVPYKCFLTKTKRILKLNNLKVKGFIWII